MRDVRWMAALQLAIAIVAPSLMSFVGVNAVVVLLAVSNAFGGVAGLYGYRAIPPRS